METGSLVGHPTYVVAAQNAPPPGQCKTAASKRGASQFRSATTSPEPAPVREALRPILRRSSKPLAFLRFLPTCPTRAAQAPSDRSTARWSELRLQDSI